MLAKNFNELLSAFAGKNSKIIIDTGGKIYIENHGQIAKYTEEEIVFYPKEQEIVISGQDLYLEFIGSDYVQVKGQISNVALKERRL